MALYVVLYVASYGPVIALVSNGSVRIEYFLILLPAGLAIVIFTTVDAIRCAKATPKEYPPARYNRWYVYAAIIFVSISIQNVTANELRLHFVEAVSIPTESMVPAVLVGDHLLVDKRAYRSSDPQRGDIAVYYVGTNSERSLKRVVGLPGESIEIRRIWS